MTRLDEVASLRTTVDRIRREMDRSVGALEQAMKSMADTFGCRTIEEAQGKLAMLEKEEDELRARFESALQEFTEKWDGKLG